MSIDPESFFVRNNSGWGYLEEGEPADSIGEADFPTNPFEAADAPAEKKIITALDIWLYDQDKPEDDFRFPLKESES